MGNKAIYEYETIGRNDERKRRILWCHSWLQYKNPLRHRRSHQKQTTQSKEGFRLISEEIKRRLEAVNGKDNYTFYSNDTICRQVSHREPDLIEFSKKHNNMKIISIQDLVDYVRANGMDKAGKVTAVLSVQNQ